MKEGIERLWDEVLKMREESGESRNSPRKEKALRLMHQLGRQDKKEEKRVQVKVRQRLAEIYYREGNYASALSQLNKSFRLCQEIADENLMIELRTVEKKINETLVVK